MEAKTLRQRARENLSGNWGISVGVAVIACMLGGLMTGSQFLPELEINIENWNISSVSDLFSALISNTGGVTVGFTSALNLIHFILGGVIQLGYARYLLKQHDRQDPQFNELFSQFDRFGQAFAQHFLRSLYTFLWSLLFIIPGIVKSYSYAMTPFIMEETPGMTASEAINASKQIMEGHKADLFWLDLTFIGWDLLCILTLNLGHLALNPYKNAARAAFYRQLCAER